MPIFAGFLGALFTRLVAYFGIRFTMQVARKIAAAALMAAVVLGFYGAAWTIINAIEFVIPDKLAIALSWVKPDGFIGLVAVHMGIRISSAAVKYQLETLKMASFVT